MAATDGRQDANLKCLCVRENDTLAEEREQSSQLFAVVSFKFVYNQENQIVEVEMSHES